MVGKERLLPKLRLCNLVESAIRIRQGYNAVGTIHSPCGFFYALIQTILARTVLPPAHHSPVRRIGAACDERPRARRAADADCDKYSD